MEKKKKKKQLRHCNKEIFYVKQQTNSAARQLAPCSRQIKQDKLATTTKIIQQDN